MHPTLFRPGLVALTALLLSNAPLPAQQWQDLGSRQVDFGGDRDVIAVTARDGWFKAIKLEVDDGTLEMFNVRVVFGDGQVFSPETRLVFRDDSRSRTIDLPGTNRVIQRVEFYYKSRVRQGKATIHLFGLQGGEARPDREHEAHNDHDGRGDGWTLLGSRMVSFRAERDVISAAGDGKFRKVLIRVQDGDLDMFNVRIVFGNGEVFSPETRLHFGNDSRSRVIDLPGEARTIRRIEFAYKSVRGGREGRATVEVLGN